MLIVRGIFADDLAGMSLLSIAKALTVEGIYPPRIDGVDEKRYPTEWRQRTVDTVHKKCTKKLLTPLDELGKMCYTSSVRCVDIGMEQSAQYIFKKIEGHLTNS